MSGKKTGFAQVLNAVFLFQIPQILAHHESFLEDLSVRLEAWDARSHTIGDWFLDCVRITTFFSFLCVLFYLFVLAIDVSHKNSRDAVTQYVNQIK